MDTSLLSKLFIVMVRYPTTPLTILFLSIFTYYDIKYREIDRKLLLVTAPAVLLGALLFFILGLVSLRSFFIALLFTAVMAQATWFLAKKGVMGDGDAFLVALVGLSNPYVVKIHNISFPPLLLTVVFGIVYILPIIISNIIHNIRRLDEFNRLTMNTSLAEKVYYFIVGKIMSVDEFKKKKFYFPLATEKMKRKIAYVGFEPLEGKDYDIEGSYVIASYGFAFATLLLTGYIIYVILLLYLPIPCSRL